MKVILLEDVKKVGKKNEVVEVSDGYARNFLIAKKLAVQVTQASMGVLNSQKQADKEHELELERQAIELKKQLEEITLNFKVKVGNGGKVFGSVSSKQIVEKLKKEFDIVVDKRKILTDVSASSLGTTRFKIDLYHNKVIGEIKVVLSEQ